MVHVKGTTSNLDLQPLACSWFCDSTSPGCISMDGNGWHMMDYDGSKKHASSTKFFKKNSKGGVLRGLIGHVPKNIQKYTRGGSLHMSAPYLDKKCFIKSFYNPGLPALCQRTQSTRYKFKTIGSDLTTSYNQELCSRTGSIFLSSLCSLHRGFLTQLH